MSTGSEPAIAVQVSTRSVAKVKILIIFCIYVTPFKGPNVRDKQHMNNAKIMLVVVVQGRRSVLQEA